MKKLLITTTLTAVLVGGFISPSFSEDVLTREQIIAEYNKTYAPAFSVLQSRLLAIKSKAYKVPALKSSWDYVMKDFLDETAIISGSINDPKGDVSAVLGYSQEESDEIGKQVAYLESQVSKIKTITCIKGKTKKTITDVLAKCPKGFTLTK